MENHIPSPFLMGKSTISTGPFSIAMNHIVFSRRSPILHPKSLVTKAFCAPFENLALYPPSAEKKVCEKNRISRLRPLLGL